MEITNHHQGKRKNNKWKYIAVFTLLIIMAGCVLINAYLLYSKVFPTNIAPPAYDYRIAVFGNDGTYPEEVVSFARGLNDELPNVSIHRGIKCTVWHWILIPSPNGIPKSFKHKNHTPYCLRFTL